MNILITGGAGFIGSHLVERLVDLKHKVIFLKRKKTDLWRVKNILSKLAIVDLDNITLNEVFEKNKVDYIIHLATKYVKKDPTKKELVEMINSNITFPSLLLDTAAKNNVKGFINTGTCFEYKLTKTKTSELTPIRPYNFYSATKLAFESILSSYVYNEKIKGITLKLFYPYGEKDNNKLITLIIRSIINNTPLNLTKGEQRLDFTYIDDIVDAYIKTLSYISKMKKFEHETFNIGSDKVVSVKKVVEILLNISKKKSRVKIGVLPYSKNEIMYINCNNQKARRKLNWTPSFNIEKGLIKTYRYYINNLHEAL